MSNAVYDHTCKHLTETFRVVSCVVPSPPHQELFPSPTRFLCWRGHQEGMLDSTPKQCESAGCNYSANFGDTTQRTRRFCARHRQEGMLSYQELVGDVEKVEAG